MIMFAYPCLVFAEIDTDLRFKLGNAAGAYRIEFENTLGHGPDGHGTNVQLEAVFNRHPKWDTSARFIMGLGLFYRQHPGEIVDTSIPIKVDYSVYGMSISPGLRLNIDDGWTFEAKIEVGISYANKVTVDSPGVNWRTTANDEYISLSPIAGCYYLFENSASRVGFEVGNQKFWGDFNISSNNGTWSDGTVSGKNFIANIIYGVQF